jgi:hypothetical protein
VLSRFNLKSATTVATYKPVDNRRVSYNYSLFRRSNVNDFRKYISNAEMFKRNLSWQQIRFSNSE